MGGANYLQCWEDEEAWSVFLVGSLNSGAEKARLRLFHTDRAGGFNMFPRASHHIITLSVMVSLGSAYVTWLSTCLDGFQPAQDLWATGLSCCLRTKTTVAVLPGSFLQGPWLSSSWQSWVRAEPGGIVPCLEPPVWNALSSCKSVLPCCTAAVCWALAIIHSLWSKLLSHQQRSLLSWLTSHHWSALPWNARGLLNTHPPGLACATETKDTLMCPEMTWRTASSFARPLIRILAKCCTTQGFLILAVNYIAKFSRMRKCVLSYFISLCDKHSSSPGR